MDIKYYDAEYIFSSSVEYLLPRKDYDLIMGKYHNGDISYKILELRMENKSITEIAKIFNRSNGSIKNEITSVKRNIAKNIPLLKKEVIDCNIEIERLKKRIKELEFIKNY